MIATDHGVRVHYETHKGGVSWADVCVRAGSDDQAHELAAEKIKSDGRRNVRRVFKTEMRIPTMPPTHSRMMPPGIPR